MLSSTLTHHHHHHHHHLKPVLTTPTATATSKLNEVVLSILEQSSSLQHLKQLQSFLITLGHSQTNFYSFKLLRFSSLKLNNLTYSRSIFNALHKPNIFLYTAMLTAYSSQSDYTSTFKLFRHMLYNGDPKPNEFIYPHVFKCPQTRIVHAHVLKSGFGGYPVVQTALVDAYSRFSSDIGVARGLFDEMSDRNVVSWTAMISGYTRVGDIGNAVALFEEMPERDVPSWNSVIAGCTQNGMFMEGISVFRRMVLFSVKERKNVPNQVTLACILSACGHTGMLQFGKSVHAYAHRYGLAYDSFVSNALVDMYGKCGSLKEARLVFDMTPKKRMTAWNSMINSYAIHGESIKAIRVFDELMKCRDENVKPDGVTFIGLLNACTHEGLVEKGRAFFKLMTNDYGIQPEIEHYGCLIDLLGRAGMFEEALDVVKTMEIEPDEVVWGSLLNGCKIYGRADLAEYAVKKLIEIDPNNGGYGIMLANLYGESGKWDEVSRVRKMLKQRNAYKTPGCSWIEVDNQVSVFYSVDKKHPRTEEIYTVLQSLVGIYSTCVAEDVA
ncbi:hypothetical protein ACFE04_028847 [Oxalis oulophora]